ncbi:MAG: hypothetical protein ACOYI6_08410 [Christensenellales bacterium]|jgi:hypothetical protein
MNDKLENRIESDFTTKNGMPLLQNKAKNSGFDIGTSTIYRQLPVGLFESSKAKKSEGCVFTGKKSAIDLWTVSDDTISIFELKAENKKVGIITEIMLYANYIHDMYTAKHTTFNPLKPSPKSKRGYASLYGAMGGLINVMAYFLTDALHPLITAEILNLMNDNGNSTIKYGNLSYELGNGLIVK